MNRYIHTALFFLFFFNITLAQTLKITVKSGKEKIAFAKVKKENNLINFTDSKGVCEIKYSDLGIGETLEIDAFSFLSYRIKITKDILLKSNVKIELEPEVYNLGEVIVRPNKDDSKLFNLKLEKDQKIPIPNRKPKEISITSVPNKKIFYNYSWIKRKFNIKTINYNIDEWTKNCMKGILKLNFTLLREFIREKERKNFSCQFLGEERGFSAWKFIRMKKKKKIDMNEEDELECIIYLDNKGFIQQLKARMSTNNKSSSSYFLNTYFVKKGDTIFAEKSYISAFEMQTKGGGMKELEVEFTTNKILVSND